MAFFHLAIRLNRIIVGFTVSFLAGLAVAIMLGG